MSEPVRVVVADDSALIRNIITSYLNAEDGFEVVGEAENGREAVQLVGDLRPDVVTLDVDMPVMSGIEALEEIMRHTPTPVVMVSGVSIGAANTTLRAIESGAVDFILKYVPGVKIDPEELRLDIVSKLRAAAEIQVVRTIRSRITTERKRLERSKSPAPTKKPNEAKTKPTQVSSTLARYVHNVLVIGASTGGPIAIKQLLRSLPNDFSAPILIVQHIPEPFTEVLAAQLNTQLPFDCAVVRDPQPLEPRKIYIAPGDMHMLIDAKQMVKPQGGPPICGHRPSIDVTMKSAAQSMADRVHAVLLTGMGEDGASGLAFVKSRGGRTFAQSAETCVVNGMPKRAIELGVVDHVASPEGIAEKLNLEINRRLRRSNQDDESPTPIAKSFEGIHVTSSPTIG